MSLKVSMVTCFVFDNLIVDGKTHISIDISLSEAWSLPKGTLTGKI
jgi:hypothetical protein